MKTTTTTETILTENAELIVSFHIGRGGRFYNAGHVTYLGERNINEFTSDLFENYENLQDFKDVDGFDDIIVLLENEDFFELEERFGITEDMLGNKVYTNCMGNSVGLAVDNDGTGTINIDNEYDATYSTRVKDLTEEEIEVILMAKNGYFGRFASELQDANNSEIDE